MKQLILLIAIISTDAWTKAYIDKTETLKESGTELGVETSFFLPTGYSNINGELESFDETEKYFEANMMLSGKYGFTNKLQGSVGLNFRFAQTNNTFKDDEQQFQASGFESVFSQLKYSFDPIRRLQYAIELNYTSRTYSNTYYEQDELPEVPEEIAIGIGSEELSFGLGFSFRTESQNFFTGRFHYRNPGSNLSNEIFSEMEFAIAWEYFAMYFGIENIYTLNQDAFKDDPENKPNLSRASSRDYNSINRAWTAPYIGVNLGLGKKWRVELKAKSRIAGSSANLGNEVLFNLIKRNSKSDSYQQKDSSFKEYKYEGSVTKVSKSKKAVSINMGLEDGVEKGSKVDFYYFDYLEGNILIASGFAVKVGTKKAIVKITKRYTKEKMREGIIARAGLVR